MYNLKQSLKQSVAYPFYRKGVSMFQYWKWCMGNKLGNPPHKVKEQIVLKFAKQNNLPVLVETGTYLGDMISAVKNSFTKVFSIEIDRDLWQNAVNKFQKNTNVKILLGDSGVVIKDLLPTLPDGVLFWLDGHFSGGVTGRGVLDSPIMQELSAIFNSSLKKTVILIDDARLFVGEGGYPTLEELKKFVTEHKPGWVCEVKNDIITIYKGV